ncbi:probable plastid-lipid-associated protein 12 chloroplastic [Phtheirospermum japonicum]|uniref:Probable plastid-lipid-associated protein 12 chloroplastic n=1 Tax=Phtheirospermum japonicum TaxID=374723 RepID=A0A830CGW0_9LAMI|nr:probable plastid-lipid-associated protein 12 chloroplastic [Phtheirospermum japonicum]
MFNPQPSTHHQIIKKNPNPENHPFFSVMFQPFHSRGQKKKSKKTHPHSQCVFLCLHEIMATLEAAIPGLRFRPLHPALHLPRTRRSITLGRNIRRQSVKFSLAGQQQVEEEVSKTTAFTEEENALINALIGIQGRGRAASSPQLQEVERAVQKLEGLKGVPDPRTFVGVDSFSVFQEVYLRTDDPRVSNIVKFSDAIGELKVEAVASIKDGKRILFRFDRAAFSFKFLPFKVPYPVPFKLLGDEAKGWLDTTYLSESGNIRISRGNKGSTFVLQKETEPRQKLISAISNGGEVREAIEEFIKLNQNTVKGELELLEGEWLMIWSSQEETESWIENAAKGLMGKQVPSRNCLRFKKSGVNTYDVAMDDAAIVAGPYGLPAEMETKFTIELLYTDEKIRISRGYNKILFVHVRVD